MSSLIGEARFGTTHWLQKQSWNPITNHGMKAVKSAL